MFFSDALTLDAPKRTRDGYLAVRARASRTGVYDYLGSEIDPNNEHGLRDAGIVKVLRDENTVFDADAVRSFIGKPVTDDHPRQPVTASNWRDHARGTVMGALRDGEYLAFDLLLTDQAIISKIDAGKRELSNGYGAELEFGSFTAKDGTPCVARQSKITGGNHVALVRDGRAGSECAIKDIAVCDAITASELEQLKASLTKDERTGSMPHTMIVDGLQVPNVSDEAKACIEKLQGQLTDANTALADAKAKADKLDGEKAAMQTQLDEAKAASDPAKLDQLAADRAALIGQAKAIAPNIVTDGKTAAEIRKAVVQTKLGDSTPESDGAIEGAFAVLAKDVKTDAKPGVQSIAPAATFADASASVDALRMARYN